MNNLTLYILGLTTSLYLLLLASCSPSPKENLKQTSDTLISTSSIEVPMTEDEALWSFTDSLSGESDTTIVVYNPPAEYRLTMNKKIEAILKKEFVLNDTVFNKTNVEEVCRCQVIDPKLKKLAIYFEHDTTALNHSKLRLAEKVEDVNNVKTGIALSKMYSDIFWRAYSKMKNHRVIVIENCVENCKLIYTLLGKKLYSLKVIPNI